jgi:hypothetical protein
MWRWRKRSEGRHFIHDWVQARRRFRNNISRSDGLDVDLDPVPAGVLGPIKRLIGGAQQAC